MRRTIELSFALIFVLVGCTPRGLPPHSLARYARTNAGEQARLVGAVAGGYVRESEPDTPLEDEDEILAVPLAETGGTYRLHELYGATVTASPGLLTVEGQLRFGQPSAAIGVVHGIGAGITSFGDDPTVQLVLLGGVFAQLGIDDHNFILLGGRYAFDDVYGGDPGMMNPERSQHWIDIGVGWLGQLFSIFGVGAELHGGLNVRSGDQPAAWYILPTVTMNAAF